MKTVIKTRHTILGTAIYTSGFVILISSCENIFDFKKILDRTKEM